MEVHTANGGLVRGLFWAGSGDWEAEQADLLDKRTLVPNSRCQIQQ
jgi:hypothetical protein